MPIPKNMTSLRLVLLQQKVDSLIGNGEKNKALHCKEEKLNIFNLTLNLQSKLMKVK